MAGLKKAKVEGVRLGRSEKEIDRDLGDRRSAACVAAPLCGALRLWLLCLCVRQAGVRDAKARIEASTRMERKGILSDGGLRMKVDARVVYARCARSRSRRA